MPRTLPTLGAADDWRSRPRTADLVEEREQCYARMSEINDRAEREHRDLRPDETRRFEEAERRFDELTSQIEEHGEPRLTRSAALLGAGAGELHGPGHAGRTVQADNGRLAPEQRMADWQASRPSGLRDIEPGEARNFNLGRLVRGMVAGRWDGAELEQRALSEGTDSAGGFLTPEVLGAQFIDLVRKQARVLEAGAQTVPLESDTHSIPRLATGVTGAWRNENAAVSEEDPTFERVTFKPKSLAVLVRLSVELFEDMTPESAAGIENDITRALALELDRVALRGTGTAPEPKGIRNQTGVEIQSLGTNGATPTMANLTTAVYGVRKDSIEPGAILWSPRTGETFAKLADTTNQPLAYPPEIADLPRLSTAQIPTNLTQGISTDCSEIYVGDFIQLLIGVRPSVGVRVKVLDQRFADTLQVGILAWLRADVQLQHPEGFVVVTGVRP